MNGAEFKAKWGLSWYKMISSEMGRDFLAFARENGPLTRTVNIPMAEVAQFGSLFTAQNQGWFDLIGVMAEQLIVTKDAPKDIGEADYTGEIEQPQPSKKKNQKRK